MKKRIFAGLLACLLMIHTFLPINGYGAYENFSEIEFTDGSGPSITQDSPFTDGFESPDSFSEEADKTAEAALNSETAAVFFNENMSVEELKTLDDTTAGAALEYTAPSLMSVPLLKPLNASQSWNFNVYYVNQPNDYHVTKTDDFNLKYQYEFHTDTNLEANAVNIKIPKVLLTDRYGRDILPWEIGVPQGTPEAFTSVSNSPFNYYTTDTDLVFFNYRGILSGTNAAVQVLYKNLKVLDIIDGTSWSIHPEISVSIANAENPEIPIIETQETVPLTGSVDTRAELLTTLKTAFKEPELSFTPGLYSPKHVERYIGPLPEKYARNFSSYAYVLWKIKSTGTATQAWEMYLKDTTKCTLHYVNYTGEVVGISVHILSSTGSTLKTQAAEPVTSGKYAGYYKTADYLRDFRERNDIKLEYYVVTAYPKKYVQKNLTHFQNNLECVLHPADGLDEDLQKNASAEWTWVDYKWTYSGNTIGINKQICTENSPDVPQRDYYGWLDTYQRASAAGQDLGNFQYEVNGIANIYGYTHRITGTSIGEYISGSYCEITTADDVLYAYPLTGDSAGAKIMLSGDDYYFSDISITQQDIGYDIFEDYEAAPEPIEKAGDIDRGLTIYAMFAGSNVWEPVDYVPWDGSDTLFYTFPEKYLSRQPWRVKAVHNSVDYSSRCQLRLTVKIRHDSPVFTSLISPESALDKSLQVKLENLSAITGKAFSSTNTEGIYFQDPSTDGHLYQEEGLAEITKNLYGTIAMRDSELISLHSLEKYAQAHKYAKVSNDPEHQRIRILYSVNAFEGYKVYSEEALNHLKQEGYETPGRKQAVFYDLLPFGVQLDPSKKITAGRLTNTSEHYIQTPAEWDESLISADVDSDTDIIQNFRGTGRTLVKFHITYAGSDSSSYDSGYWMNGYGLSFHAYCDWKDVPSAENVPNICAYMPETGDLSPIMGTENEVAYDDGIIVPAENSDDYRYFGKDINEDGITNIRNILYCQATAFEDLAIASQSGIDKTVRADSDRFGIFDQSAVVGEGDGYTYNITVTNTSRQPLKDIVVFDRLENAAKDRPAEETSMNFDSSWWHGTFLGIGEEMLKEAQIKPVIYFHADRSTAPLPLQNERADTVLTEGHGWYERSRWPGSLSDVQAVAVDLSLKEDGTEFALGNMESISFRICMKAPVSSVNAVYAYNNPAFSSLTIGTTEDENVRHTVYGNSTKVQLKERKILEIVKEFQGDIPEIRKESTFPITVTRETDDNRQLPYASKEYALYLREGDQWIRQNGIHATDTKGNLYLKAGEKAVFKEAAGVSMLHVTEEENPFWKQTMEETVKNDCRQITFFNEYRPVLYLRKSISGVPDNIDVSEDVFHFQITCNGLPAAKKEFWYVDREVPYGSIPQKLGNGFTDENGVVSLHARDILAVFPGYVDNLYEVTELSDSYGDNTNWIGKETSASGTLSIDGNTAAFENLYKWKELYLSKNILNPASDSCNTEFSFKIWELPDGGLKDPFHPENGGILVTGKAWELLDSEKKPLDTPVGGVIGADGILKCRCSDKVIRIEKLEAGKTYVIQEVNVPENYETVNNGLAEVKMPLYARSESTEITNDYLLRPLEVTKIVIPRIGDTDSSINLEGKLFEMKLSIKDGNSFVPKSDFPYQVIKNGKTVRTGTTDSNGAFSIAGTETAFFESLGREGLEYQIQETPDTDYPQIYPPAEVPAHGMLEKSGSKTTLINGDAGNLVIRKEYSVAENDLLMENTIAFEEFLKDEFFRTQLLIEIDSGNGFLPLDSNILLIDNENGTLTRTHINAETPLMLNSTQTVVIQNLPPDTPFKVEEAAGYKHRFMKDITYTDSLIFIDQISPIEDGAVTGITGIDNSAVIVNELRSFKLGSRIYKIMTADSEPVPVGSELVMRVERFTNFGWRPASGVEYLLMNQEETDGLRKFTDSDGIIRLFKSEQGIPSIQFNQTVNITFDDTAREGDLRIVEVPKLSDEIWGFLEGYSSSAYINASREEVPPRLDQPSELADTFVNTNVVRPVEIEKKLQAERSERSFLMKLTPAADFGFTDVANLRLPYSIFDSATREMLGSGITDVYGEFSLKAGEYALFHLRPGSTWTVSEQLPFPYKLDSVSGNSESIEVRADHSVKIQIPSVEIADGILTRDMVDFGVYDVESGAPINLTSGDITIPPQVLFNGKKITLKSIDKDAFKNRTYIRTVSVTAPISSISSGAFAGCSSLEHIDLPDSLQTLKFSAFENCSSLKSIHLPDTVTTLPNYVFSGCRSLETIQIADSVTSIGTFAFQDCRSLKSIVLPPQLKAVRDNLFEGCESLTNVLIPANVTSIGESAFYGCSSLTAIDLPGGVTTIGPSAFENCSRLTELTIPTEVATIGSYAFRYCHMLKKISLSDKITTIGSDAFAACTALSGIYIAKPKDSVTGAPWGAKCPIYWQDGTTEAQNNIGQDYEDENFYYKLVKDLSKTYYHLIGCKNTNLTHAEIPASINGIKVNKIAAHAFEGCSNLKSVIIPDTLELIGDYAFSYCTSLTDVDLPENLKGLSSRAFSNCINLVSISIPYSVIGINMEVFFNCRKLQTIKIPDAVQYIGIRSFCNCTSLTEVVLPDGLTNLEEAAFRGCSSLKSIRIPNKITKIRRHVFSDCSSLQNIEFHDGITLIDQYAFKGCRSLQNLNLPVGLTQINSRGFSGCSSLTAVEIPENVTDMATYTFEDCSNLTEITLRKTKDSITGAPWSAPNKKLLVHWIGVRN